MNFQSLVKTALYKAGYSIKKVRKTPYKSAAPVRTESGATPATLMQLLHRTNPYEGFDYSAIPFDPHGWGGQSPAFRELISQIRPQLIIEVGTWKGASALEMASACRDCGLSTQILCIDTWLGALEFWTDQADPERYLSLNLRHGYPSVYYQFLANVCHRGFQETIIPFPQTSSTAALWLRTQAITAPMIYVDASHEEEDVYEDLCRYWDLVSAGGVLFGDDYSWDGVRLAVDRFSKENRLALAFVADKWVLRSK